MSDLTGVQLDYPEHLYHQRPELSSTGARQILDSPARFDWARKNPQPHKEAFSLGTAIHTKILGVGAGIITYPDEHLTPSGAVSAKAATVAWADERRAEGLTVISPQQAAQVDGMTEAVLANSDARDVLESIEGREVSIFTEVDGVSVRARFDLYDGVKSGDLKSARDASPKGFNTSVARYGYAVQEQWYRDAHNAENGEPLESFKFVVVESTAPYLVGVYELDFMWEEIAREKTKRARDLYRECTETGIWPGYPTTTLTPPTWAMFDADEDEEIQV